MIKSSSYLIWTVLLFFVFLFSSCGMEDEFPVNFKILCDAEQVNAKGNKFISANDSLVFFDGGNLRSSKTAFEGKYSVRTIAKKQPYAMGYHIQNAKPDSYFKVSVWRKSNDGKGVLVVTAKNTELLYLAASTPVVIAEDGWEKLELEVYTPPHFGEGKLSFYVWNNGSDTVYFDNLKIERQTKKKYPEFKENLLSIVLDTNEYLKILDKRKRAFEKGILQSEDNDWVNGIVFSGQKVMKAKLRLKGDWLDHLHGDKWSYRIKMKKNNSWNRLRTFSIQTPLARNYLIEWLTHQFYQQADVLTTRYGFVPVMFNNQNRGLYAWEEHFAKQLLESKNRREGPIVKFSEESFWQVQMIFKKTKEWLTLPYYEAATITPFGQSKTVESPALFQQFLNAQKLMFQYKNNIGNPSDIFDIDKLARYYAMLELTHARHGMAWHNQRMYYNPVICKLELIAFDGYADIHEVDINITDNLVYRVLTQKDDIRNDQSIIFNLFTDNTFLKVYFKYLEKYSSEDFVNNTIANLQPEINLYDSLLKLEFPYYHYDEHFMQRSALKIREYLPEVKKLVQTELIGKEIKFEILDETFSQLEVYQNTPELFVNAYTNGKQNDTISLEVFNYYPNEIIVLGTGSMDRFIEFYQHPEPRIKGFRNKTESLQVLSDTSSKFLFFMVDGHDETFKVEIFPWPSPQGETYQQQLMSTVDLNNKDIFESIIGNDIYVRSGNIKIDYPVIIPKGYVLHFTANTTIDLVDSAMFISYSPIEMIGTKKEPITITSSDFSANGFTILQAEGRSKLKNVIFENLNTLNNKGWTITGSVTFYESDVDIEMTTFYRNQCEDALNIVRSDFIVDNATFDNIYGDAFDSDFSTGKVINTLFTNIGNDAIDFSGSQIIIEDTRILGANDKGISGGEDSHLTVNNVFIEKANIGIASKDLSIVKINNCEIVDCNYGLLLLQKKPEYGPSSIILNNTKITNPKQKYLIELGSEIIWDGEKIKGNIKNVADLFY